MVVASVACGLGLGAVAPASAHGVLQCAPYARSVSGISLSGDAKDWWGNARGLYERGQTPAVGSVLAFRASHTMPHGHVATVSRVIDGRHVLLNHANWSRPGMIERSALAEDVSAKGDWSEVRVWYAPQGSLGTRPNAAFGFIYSGQAPAGDDGSAQQIALADTSRIGG